MENWESAHGKVGSILPDTHVVFTGHVFKQLGNLGQCGSPKETVQIVHHSIQLACL